jgi:hypothetical protein
LLILTLVCIVILKRTLSNMTTADPKGRILGVPYIDFAKL